MVREGFSWVVFKFSYYRRDGVSFGKIWGKVSYLEGIMWVVFVKVWGRKEFFFFRIKRRVG